MEMSDRKRGARFQRAVPAFLPAWARHSCRRANDLHHAAGRRAHEQDVHVASNGDTASRFTAGRPRMSFLSALGRSQRSSGAWGGAKIGRLNGRFPLSTTPETQSRGFEISNPRTVNKIVSPSPSTLPPPCYSGPVRAPVLQGATDWRTPAGI